VLLALLILRGRPAADRDLELLVLRQELPTRPLERRDRLGGVLHEYSSVA
jgi:hypothetical protein